MSNHITTINDKGRKRPYIKPDSEVIELNVSGSINEAHVSDVKINGFNEGEVPPITVVEDDDEDDANAKQNGMWSDDDAI